MKNLVWMLPILLTACKTVYVPNGRNSPMFTEAGELQLSASISTGDYGSGPRYLTGNRTFDFDFQTAFSVSEHLGFIGNYAFTNAMNRYQHHSIGEAGIGYYDNTGKSYFEIFGGFGKGHGISPYVDEYAREGHGDTGYTRVFIQPALGWNKNVNHISIVTRFSFVHFSQYPDYHSLYPKPLTIMFFEPGVVGRVNFHENLFFQWHLGLSIWPKTKYSGLYLDGIGVNINIGLGGRTGLLRKKHK